MDRVETLLSETLTERAGHAPPGPVPLAERSRRVRTSMTMIAASVAVIVVAILAATLHTGGPTQPPTQHSAPPLQPDLPAGIRIASYGQASVQVPAALLTRRSLCGGPVAQEVVADAGTARLCPVVTTSLASQPGIVVWLSAASQFTPYASIPMSPAEVDGRDAARGYATDKPGLGAGVSGVVRFPANGITIGVTAPTRIAVDDILSTIVIAPVNPLGCAANLDAATTAPPGPSDLLVPSDASGAVSCEYGTGSTSGQLIGSYTLDPPDTAQLTTALNALVPDPCRCDHGGTPAPGYTEVLYFRYPDGSTLRVTGDIGANLDSYTNQSRTVANYSSSISQLLARLTNQR